LRRNDGVVFRPIFFSFPSYTWQGRCAALAARKSSDPAFFFAGPGLLGQLHKSPRSHTSLPWILRSRWDMVVFDFRPRRRVGRPFGGRARRFRRVPTVNGAAPQFRGALCRPREPPAGTHAPAVPAVHSGGRPPPRYRPPGNKLPALSRVGRSLTKRPPLPGRGTLEPDRGAPPPDVSAASSTTLYPTPWAAGGVPCRGDAA